MICPWCKKGDLHEMEDEPIFLNDLEYECNFCEYRIDRKSLINYCIINDIKINLEQFEKD